MSPTPENIPLLTNVLCVSTATETAAEATEVPATTEAAVAAPVEEEAKEEAKEEEAKKDAEPVEDGQLEHKGSNFPKYVPAQHHLRSALFTRRSR